jgi:hypothetical protein
MVGLSSLLRLSAFGRGMTGKGSADPVTARGEGPHWGDSVEEVGVAGAWLG